VARRFLRAVGFTHGLFNMEFFYDAATDKLTVIEFNPRMAAQFSDLYLRVDGIDLHRVALELAHGRDPALLPRAGATAGVAASFVYRSFDPAARPPMPTAGSGGNALARSFPMPCCSAFPRRRPDRPRFQVAGQLSLRHPASGRA
jgi:biotin carboxylase